MKTLSGRERRSWARNSAYLRGISAQLRVVTACLAPMLALSGSTEAQQKRPLAASDIADITTLVMLEDTRDFNADALRRILGSSHPEVRRRAVTAIARINDPRGRALLNLAQPDADTSVAATVIFAVGQLKDSTAVPHLDSLLMSASTPVTVAFEAARALGKIRTPEARVALARYLNATTEHTRTRSVIGEALLSIGRNTTRGDIASIVRHTQSNDEEVRWRATWALFRPRDPVALPELLRLSGDRSGHVRSWALRALTAPQVDSASIGRPRALAVLLAAAQNDSDRRARTEALRTLIAYDDSASFDLLVRSLNSQDSWISVSAAENLARRTNRSADAIAALTKAAAPDRPSALRIVAVQSLLALSPESAREPALLLAQDSLPMSKQVAAQVANRLNPPPPSNTPRPGGGGRNTTRPINTGKTEADYRAIVERWVVPAYNGAARPRFVWTTAKGEIELELYPGEAPLATENFMAMAESNAVVGTDFSRVVPDFVDQQRTIPNSTLQRDEVTRLGLTRGNLSWASAGLDTGRPGYTLGSTPQPHNEGDFTTLGRVVRGMDVVDRIALGDRVLAVRIVR